MRGFFKLFSRGFLVLVVALVVFWIWGMPKANTRGVWLTEGYGFAIEITPFTIDIREASPISCDKLEDPGRGVLGWVFWLLRRPGWPCLGGGDEPILAPK